MKDRFKQFILLSLLIGSSILVSCIKLDLSGLANLPYPRTPKEIGQPAFKADVITFGPTNITDSSATLNGYIHPCDTLLNVSFKYFMVDSLGRGDTLETSPMQKLVCLNYNVSANITGLAAGKTYFYYISATNINRQISGKIMPLATNYPPDQLFGGGIKFYVDGTGHHGLIAAPYDQNIGNGGNTVFSWGYTWRGVPTGTSIGDGQKNTFAIVSAMGSDWNAARICNDLVLNGYDDWYLPSRDELNLLYKQRKIIGGLYPNAVYWSSSESSVSTAWSQCFGDGWQHETSNKDNAYYVRAIRSF